MGHTYTVAGALACHLHTEYCVSMCCCCARSVSICRCSTDSCAIGVPLVSEVVIATCSFNLQHRGNHIFAISRILACRSQLQRIVYFHFCHLHTVAGALACHLHTEYCVSMRCCCARSVSICRCTTDSCAIGVPLVSEVVIATCSFNLQHGGNHIFAISRILACRCQLQRIVYLHLGHLNTVAGALAGHLHTENCVGVSYCSTRSVSVSRSTTDSCAIGVPLICEVVITTGSFNLQHGCYHVFAISRILACRSQLQCVINLHFCHLNAVAGTLASHLHTENCVGVSCRCAWSVGVSRSTADGCAIGIPLISEVVIAACCFNLQHGCYHIFAISRILAYRGQFQRIVYLHLCHLDAVAGALADYLHTENRIGVSCRCTRSVGISRSTTDSCAIGVPLICEVVITACCFNLQHGCYHILAVNRILT